MKIMLIGLLIAVISWYTYAIKSQKAFINGMAIYKCKQIGGMK